MNIDYPSKEQIEEQQSRIMERAFKKKLHRPPLSVVFRNSYGSVLISLSIHLLLALLLGAYSLGRRQSGYIALAVFPLTYFAFFLLSLLADEQNGLVELKGSLPYSLGYVVSLRMFYASLAAVPLNLLLLVLFFGRLDELWSLGAAGVSASLSLALLSLISYERFGSSKPAAVMAAVWTVGCLVLTRHGAPLYELIIKTVPLAVHIVAAAGSLSAFTAYIGKVEKQNAYGF